MKTSQYLAVSILNEKANRHCDEFAWPCNTACQIGLFLQSNGVGTLKVSGYIRGQALSANGLVHLPGWGDFQLLQIEAATEPFPDTRPKTVNTGKRGVVPMVIAVSNISEVTFTFVYL